MEVMQREYLNFNEQILRRYLKCISFLQARFPWGCDDVNPPWVLLRALKERFKGIRPGVNYSDYALALK